jgi:hypothetical protein
MIGVAVGEAMKGGDARIADLSAVAAYLRPWVTERRDHAGI